MTVLIYEGWNNLMYPQERKAKEIMLCAYTWLVIIIIVARGLIIRYQFTPAGSTIDRTTEQFKSDKVT